MKKDKLDLLRDLCVVEESITSLFGDTDILSGCIDTLGNMIAEDLGIPDDNTLTKTPDDKDYRCNDLWFMSIYDFSGGKISKKQLINKIDRLNKRYGKKGTN